MGVYFSQTRKREGASRTVNGTDRTWAEINLNAIRHNCKAVVDSVGMHTGVMAVIKANAYGHGAIPVAKACIEAGARWLAVATGEEALELRDAGIETPVLVLGSPGERTAELVDARVVQTVHSLESLERIERTCGHVAEVHLKLETGMNRIGVKPGLELESLIRRLSYCRHVRVSGVFTHFASAEDAEAVRRQLDRFYQGLRQLEKAGLGGLTVHAASSAAALLYPESRFDLVRPGIMLYGYHPCEQTKPLIQLRPALTWKAAVVQVKRVEPGDKISYGGIYTAATPRVVATVAVGYADGYRRSLSGKAFVLANGLRAPVLGRVCMDYLMVDVTDCGEPDYVVLLGPSLPADYHAALLDSIPYEVLTSISPRVTRVYVE
ncbi:MAG TPA: alanine racemase [Firmicutes bacterium]|nr:alanine racemase [Bacillota bacterium]